MKKTTFTLALATALFTSITLLNCSKKSDPAPSTTAGSTTSGTTTGSTTTPTTSGTTTSGTTTSGTTTSGTTTTGTTTSGTTTSGTTTSGTTTSGTTTSGTTTSGTTTSGTKIGGSGTLTIDGVDYSPKKMTFSIVDVGFGTAVNVSFTTSLDKAIVAIKFFNNTSDLNTNYSMMSVFTNFEVGKAAIQIAYIKDGGYKNFFTEATTLGTIALKDKTVTFKDIVIKEYNGTNTIKVSGDFTFE